MNFNHKPTHNKANWFKLRWRQKSVASAIVRLSSKEWHLRGWDEYSATICIQNQGLSTKVTVKCSNSLWAVQKEKNLQFQLRKNLFLIWLYHLRTVSRCQSWSWFYFTLSFSQFEYLNAFSKERNKSMVWCNFSGKAVVQRRTVM